MARIARVVAPNHPHHVTQRGNRRMETFFRNEDYETYIKLMASACKAVGTEVWAYCLMPNHVHLVMVPKNEDGLRAALGEAHRRYTRHINFREKWRGHLWQERFHSFPMDEQYLLATVRYVERNPVSAKLCEKPEQWRWSSASAHLQGRDDRLVSVRPMLQLIHDWKAYLAQEGDAMQIATIQQHLRTGRPLGATEFIEQIEKKLGRMLKRLKPGPKPVEDI